MPMKPEMDPHHLHELFMDLMLVTGLLQPGGHLPGRHVPMSQAFALHQLHSGEPLSQQELADRLNLEKSSVSRLITELERQGLVERQRDPANGRHHRLQITDAGRALHTSLAATFHDSYVRWIDAMTSDERHALAVGLSAFVREVRAHPLHGRTRGTPSAPRLRAR